MNHYLFLIIFFISEIFISCTLFAKTETEKYDPQTEYENYFKRRYKSADVAANERNCLNDLENHLYLLHQNYIFIDHYANIAEIVEEIANERSLGQLEKLINVCFSLEEMILRKLDMCKNERERDVVENKAYHFSLIRQSLSNAWLRAFNNKNPNTILNCLKKDSDIKIHPESKLFEYVLKLDKSKRGEIYSILKSNDFRDDTDCGLSSLFRSDKFKATEKEIIDFIKNSKNKLLKARAIKYLQLARPNYELGHKIAFDDLVGNNGWKGLDAYRDYFLSESINKKIKEKLFSEFMEYLSSIEIECMIGDEEKEMEVLSIMSMVFVTLIINNGENQFIKSKYKDLLPHFEWYKEQCKGLGPYRNDKIFLKSIEKILKNVRLTKPK